MTDLPPALAAALRDLGVRVPPPPRKADAPAWRPSYPGEEPPF